MFKIPLIDIVIGFSSAIELISPQMSNHQKRVAYIAYSISKEMGFNQEEKNNILIAGLLHDSGALHEEEMIRAFKYDFGVTFFERHSHGYKGWQLYRNSEDLKIPAEIIKFHHIYWNERNSDYLENYSIPLGSHIIHLADRIDTLIKRDEEILNQRIYIENKIKEKSGEMFMPDAVEAFLNVSKKECFWFDLKATYIEEILRKIMVTDKTKINIKKLTSLVSIFYQIIDFRSKFTATHSIGVAECAKALSIKMNFSKTDSQLIYIAGLLHDLGKLTIPVEILEKNGPLSANELNIIKKHTFYSYRIIDRVPQMEKVNRWASFHHERLDGKGYPFKLMENELDLGSKIMAVSDVFTALTEKRPYREAIPVEEALIIMEQMVKIKHLDAYVFSVLKLNIDEINQLKLNVQNLTLKKHVDYENVRV